MTDVTIKINGELRSTSVPPETTLLKMLRENFNLTGAKLGCDVGDCGRGATNSHSAGLKSLSLGSCGAL